MRFNRPGWRTWATTIGVCLLSSLLSIVVSVRVAEQNTRDQIDRARQAAYEQRKITCNTFAALIAVYVETPPISRTGRNVQRAYEDQYRALNCPPLPPPEN